MKFIQAHTFRFSWTENTQTAFVHQLCADAVCQDELHTGQAWNLNKSLITEGYLITIYSCFLSVWYTEYNALLLCVCSYNVLQKVYLQYGTNNNHWPPELAWHQHSILAAWSLLSGSLSRRRGGKKFKFKHFTLKTNNEEVTQSEKK